MGGAGQTRRGAGGLPARALVAAVVVPFFVLLFVLHANRDLWFDEVATVRLFVLVPPLKTVTWYPYTNNHVLSNFVNNVFLRVVGVREFADVAAWPFLLRWMPMLYAGVAMAYVHAVCRRSFGTRAAVIAVACLATSLPFFNFAPQIRGYSLSMALLAMMIFHAWAFADTGSRLHAALAVVGAGLALYALPSNLYFVVAFGAAHAGLAVGGRLRSRRAATAPSLVPPGGRRDVVIAALAAGGVGLACLLYAPILKDLVASPIVASYAPLRWKTLYAILPSIAFQLLSHQYVIAALAALGLALLARGRVELTAARHRAVVASIVVLVLPFMFSFLRGDWPVDRVFVNEAIVVAILVGVGVDAALDWSPIAARGLLGPVVAVLVCLEATFVVALWRVDASLDADIDAERVPVQQDLLGNYFLGPGYDMRGLADRFAALPDARTTPVVAYDLEWPAVTEYLRDRRIDVARRSAFEALLADHDELYVFTGFPRRFAAELAASHPLAVATRAVEGRNRLTVLSVRRGGR